MVGFRPISAQLDDGRLNWANHRMGNMRLPQLDLNILVNCKLARIMIHVLVRMLYACMMMMMMMVAMLLIP